MSKKLIFVFLVGFLYTIACIAQTQNQYEAVNRLATIPIQNPDVAALNKFVEFPVSHFNGQVDVSLPLYEIKLKDVTVPIRLKYHTGGIRVSEDASWVGLGWALDAGGVISHQVNGYDDQAPQSVINKEFGNYFPYQTASENESFSEGIAISGFCIDGKASVSLWNYNGQKVNIRDKLLRTKIDSDPDLYIYNMGNYSGKFIVYRDKEIDISGNNIAFTLNTLLTNSIIAVTPDGNTYKFEVLEHGLSRTGIQSVNAPYDAEFYRPKITAYYISEIITANGEQIKFFYKRFKEKCDEKNWSYPKDNKCWLSNGIYHFLQPPALFEEYSHDKTTSYNPNMMYIDPSADEWAETRCFSNRIFNLFTIRKNRISQRNN